MDIEKFNQQSFNIIFGRLDRIFDIHTRQTKLSRKEYIEILNEYCAILSALTNGKGLRHILEMTQRNIRDQNTYQEARDILKKTDSFLEFLVLEKQLLISVGVSEAFSNYLIDKLAFLRTQCVSNMDDLAAAHEWIDGLEHLSKVVCAASDETDGTGRWLKTKKYGIFTGGWLLVVANGSAGFLGSFAGIPQIAVPGAIVSIVGGRTLIKISDEM